MDIQSEKAKIIKRFEQINDEYLVKAFKNLLDYALRKEEEDAMLDASISKGLSQSKNGEVKPHNEVMDSLRQKYKE